MSLVEWLRRAKNGKSEKKEKKEKKEGVDEHKDREPLQGIALVRRIERTANSLGAHYREEQLKNAETRDFQTVLDEITLLQGDLEALRKEIPSKVDRSR